MNTTSVALGLVSEQLTSTLLGKLLRLKYATFFTTAHNEPSNNLVAK